MIESYYPDQDGKIRIDCDEPGCEYYRRVPATESDTVNPAWKCMKHTPSNNLIHPLPWEPGYTGPEKAQPAPPGDESVYRKRERVKINVGSRPNQEEERPVFSSSTYTKEDWLAGKW
jgi:hypothetical protein